MYNSMATLVLRNAQIRATCRRFSSYALKQLTSLNASLYSSSPAIDFIHGMSSLFPIHHPVARSTLIGAFGVGNHVMRQQSLFLCSAAGAAPSSNLKTQGAEKIEEVKPKDGGNSGSQQSAETGKAVRGGPVSWLSFLLLVITGAGIIWYYDNEKKRHIEGILVY